jgi:hypothetical protein
MAGYSFKNKTLYQLLHFDNTQKYSILQDVLGHMVLVGFQRHIRYKDGNLGLHLNNMTNIVLCDSTSYATIKACFVKKTINAPGIDLIFGE